MFYLNERRCILLSLLVAELGASYFFFLLFPANILVSSYPSKISYIGAHLVPTVIIWVILAVLTWVLANPKLFRARSKDKSKLRAILVVCLIGTIVNAAASFYLWFAMPDHATRSRGPGELILGLVARTVLYLIFYGFTTALMVMSARRLQRLDPNPPQ